jgi:hypothetical protein
MIVCPRCAGELARAGAELRCVHCAVSYADVAGIPCLFEEATRRRMRGEIAAIRAEADATMRVLSAELERPGLCDSTKRRLERQRALAGELTTEVETLLREALGPGPATPVSSVAPLQSLHRLFRDWAWPESDENDRALACVQRVAAGPLGRTLVIGAGACRLAYDLAPSATSMLALDIDVLVFSIARRVLAGERVELTEAWIDALDLERLGRRVTLEAPHGPRAIDLLLADGIAPPLRAESFDTIVTPWFIDLVPPDLRAFTGVIRRLLVDGGRWLSFGPLLYPVDRSASRRFGREEIADLAARAGLPIDASHVESIPFASSPFSGRGRRELCLAFSARKTAIPPDRDDVPSWAVLPYLPVPKLRAIPTDLSAAARLIAELADGTRSIEAIARELNARTGATSPSLEDAIRHTLLTLGSARGRVQT